MAAPASRSAATSAGVLRIRSRRSTVLAVVCSAAGSAARNRSTCSAHIRFASPTRRASPSKRATRANASSVSSWLTISTSPAGRTRRCHRALEPRTTRNRRAVRRQYEAGQPLERMRGVAGQVAQVRARGEQQRVDPGPQRRAGGRRRGLQGAAPGYGAGGEDEGPRGGGAPRGAMLRALVPRMGPRARGSGSAVRPRPEVWSPLEYACHVRDVFVLYDERLRLMLETDNPTYANWDQDATAVEQRYAGQDPSVVATELRDAAEALADRFDTVSGEQWARTGTRSDGARFTVESFARYFVHDPIHHLHDVEAGH